MILTVMVRKVNGRREEGGGGGEHQESMKQLKTTTLTGEPSATLTTSER